MAKKRVNPFTDLGAAADQLYELPVLSPWTWKLQGLVAGGDELSFSSFSHRPRVYRPLLTAMWKNKVDRVPPLAYSGLVLQRFYISLFERFLASHANRELRDLSSLKQLSRETLVNYRRWLYEQVGSSTAGKSYRALASLLVTLRGDSSPVPGAINDNLEIPLKGLLPGDHGAEAASPFNLDEQAAIELASKKAMNLTLARLQDGKKLLSQGSDPRINDGYDASLYSFRDYAKGWDSTPNILWYVAHVLQGRMPSASSAEGCNEPLRIFLDKSPTAPITMTDAFDFLFPNSKDIIPFIVLLTLKTGLNAESILSLGRDCLQGSEGNMTWVEYKKTRGSHEVMRRKFSHRGAYSPVGIIKTVLNMTEGLMPIAIPGYENYLWLCHQIIKGKKGGGGGEFSNKAGIIGACHALLLINGRKHEKSPGFFEIYDVRGRDGNVLHFTFLSARKTDATNAYLKHGNLANVSKKVLKHHGKAAANTTAIHYLSNDATKHIHDSTIRNAQDKTVTEARIITITNDNPNDTELKNIATNLNLTKKKVLSIVKGEQDVFIASCKDFYNKPGGQPDTPCNDAWQCFGCSNGLWTARILPRLIKFMWFIEEQRLLLDEVDWRMKFGKAYDVITGQIMPRFQAYTIEWAKIEAKSEPLYIPANLRDM